MNTVSVCVCQSAEELDVDSCVLVNIVSVCVCQSSEELDVDSCVLVNVVSACVCQSAEELDADNVDSCVLVTRVSVMSASVCQSAEELDADNVILWERVSELSTCAITRIVEFSKQVPGFSTLTTSDQITLLKGSCLEILVCKPIFVYTVLGNHVRAAKLNFVGMLVLFKLLRAK